MTLERDEQRAVIGLYREFGLEVVIFSQPQRSLQTPGIPDLKVYCPRKALTWWHETKRTDGKPSQRRPRRAQVDFAALARSCREVVVTGGREEAKERLREVGLIPAWVGQRQPVDGGHAMKLRGDVNTRSTVLSPRRSARLGRERR